MPELPEVETIVRELRGSIIGKTIQELRELRSATIRRLSVAKKAPLGSVTSIDRRGKYLVFSLSSNLTMVIHLGMTGKLIVATRNQTRPSHLRAEFTFADGSLLLFDDIRTFGHITIQKNTDPLYFEIRMGAEPLSPAFTTGYLQPLLAKRKSPIKPLLLDQKLVAGIGNIYACEALYRAGISPATSAPRLTAKQTAALVREIKEILSVAIEHNGTTISDYRRVDDKTGDFQNFLQVYQKTACPRGHAVQKISQSGRSTYFCPVCQDTKNS